MNIISKHRWRATLVGLASMLVLAGLQAVAASPAAALPGLERVVVTSASDSVSPKTVTPTCPAGKRIVGGGGWAFALAAADEKKVLLTRLEPQISGSLNRYVVSAQEVAPGMAGNWWLEGYALCADPPAGHQIVSQTTASSSTAIKQASALCPGGTRVLGTGGRINNPGGEVTLQVANSSAVRDRGQATAREDASGYSANWSLTAFAVCANSVAGFSAQSATSAQTGSEDTKVVNLTCPLGTFVHNVGAATSGQTTSIAPAGVAIQVAFPSSNGRQAMAFAVETSPTSAGWQLQVQAICGP